MKQFVLLVAIATAQTDFRLLTASACTERDAQLMHSCWKQYIYIYAEDSALSGAIVQEW